MAILMDPKTRKHVSRALVLVLLRFPMAYYEEKKQ